MKILATSDGRGVICIEIHLYIYCAWDVFRVSFAGQLKSSQSRTLIEAETTNPSTMKLVRVFFRQSVMVFKYTYDECACVIA